MEYKGTNYCGWQLQPNGLSIQEVLEGAIFKVTGREVRVCGSGRTDAGVHALAQVAHFRVETHLEACVFQPALNHHLPHDIVIKEAVEESSEFHAQFCQKGKRYVYTILNRKYPSAFLYHYSWLVPYPLDVESMKEAATSLVGRHDFAAFQASGTHVKKTVRNLTRLDIEREEDKLLFVVEGSGFLKYMVRILVGTLTEVGSGRMPPEWVKEVLESGDRQKAGRTAPGCGLCLEKVYY